MAFNDVRIKFAPNGADAQVQTFQTDAGDGDLYAGDIVTLKAEGSPYVVRVADGKPVIGAGELQVIGLAVSPSTHTASADGTIKVQILTGEYILEAKATTGSNVDTQAKIDALQNDCVTLDVNSTVITIDENEGDAADHGCQIVGGDPEAETLWFRFRTPVLERATS